MIFGTQVPTFFTNNGGVSISEVARRQAEAKQQNDEFWGRITDAVAGVFRKVLSFVGAGNSTPQTIDGPKVTPEDLKGYAGVAERNAVTAVLMHGVKLYKRLQQELESMDLRRFLSPQLSNAPERPKLPEPPQLPERPALATVCETDRFMDIANIDEMIANLKPAVLAQFDFAFWKKANELNARAAAIGKLLSEQGSLFRELIRPLPKGGEQMTQTGVVVTRWEKAYSAEELVGFAEQRNALQAEYNDLQKQLNGLKKQVKDAVRAYNLEQERSYQQAFGEYQLAYASHQAAVDELLANHQTALKQYARDQEQLRSSAETLRQQALQELAALRVRVE